MDCSLPGSSVHGISQARILNGLSFPSPEDLLGSGMEPGSPALAGGFLTTEPPGRPICSATSSMKPVFNYVYMFLIIISTNRVTQGNWCQFVYTFHLQEMSRVT